MQLIQERLYSIEANLIQLISATQGERQNDVNLASRSIDVRPPRTATRSVHLTPSFEGDSSFASTAILAENVAESASKENTGLPEDHMIHACPEESEKYT